MGVYDYNLSNIWGCLLDNMNRLHIGCGYKHLEGYHNIDIAKHKGVDEVVDIEKGLPYKDNFYDEIYMANVLQHMKDTHFIMRELHRVCKGTGKIIIRVPHFTNYRAYTPFIYYYFNHDCFNTYRIQGKDTIDDMLHTKGIYFEIQTELIFRNRFFNGLLNWFFNKHKFLYEDSFLRNIFPCDKIEFTLQPIK